MRYLVLLTSLGLPATVVGQPPLKPAAGDNRELHVVCVHEGNHKTDGKIHGGKAAVRVDRPGKAITLVLSSYNPVTWEVTVGANSEIKKVILAGYHRQAVSGVMCEVVEAFYEAKPRTKYFYAPYTMERATFRSTVKAIHDLTGLEILSFQGRYTYDPKAPFVVSQIQTDPRLRSDYPTPTPAAELPKLDFKALHFVQGDRFGVSASYGEFGLAGPKLETLRQLPRDVRRLAVDSAGNKFYGLGNHELFEVDLAKQATTKIDLGLDVPRLSWPCGLTFDTKRNRLIIASRGYLYAYDVKNAKASVLSEQRFMELPLAYSAKEDVLYGVTQDMGDSEGGKAFLCKFNAEGALLNKTALSEPMFPGVLGRLGGLGTPTQLISVGDQLVILASTGGDRPGQAAGESFMFLVDPGTAKVRLTWRK